MNNDVLAEIVRIDRKKFWDPAFFLNVFHGFISHSQLKHHYSILKFCICLQVKCVTVILSYCLKRLFLLVNYLLFSRFWTQHLMISSPLFNPGSIRFCVCYCTWRPSVRYSVLQRLLGISAKCLLINAVPSSPSSFAGHSICPTASSKCCSIGGQGVRL